MPLSLSGMADISHRSNSRHLRLILLEPLRRLRFVAAISCEKKMRFLRELSESRYFRTECKSQDSAGEFGTILRWVERFAISIPIIAQFYAGALLTVVTWWVEQEMRVPVEELARYLDRLLSYEDRLVIKM
jgi:hypothetical protein